MAGVVPNQKLVAGIMSRVSSIAFAQKQEVPQLTIRLYGHRALSAYGFGSAEHEAERMLHTARIRLNWLDCLGPVIPSACTLQALPTDLDIYFWRTAPRSSPPGEAAKSASERGKPAAVFVFFDRVFALSANSVLLPTILGRILAHEIAHVLLPREHHSTGGLMRGRWSSDDLKLGSTSCLGLSPRFVRLMETEALRRVEATRMQTANIRLPAGSARASIRRQTHSKYR